MKVTIVGVGYVGLTTAIALAHVGHKVKAVDKDLSKLQMLKNGKSPIHERYIEELLEKTRSNIEFSDDLIGNVGDADVIIIAVGTPSLPNGDVNVSYVEAAATEIASGLTSGQNTIIVVKSTVPIGGNSRTASLVHKVLRNKGINIHVHFASNPEFLREGVAIKDTLFPERIVIGADSELAFQIMTDLYQPILSGSFNKEIFKDDSALHHRPFVVKTSITSAEMIKYASNAFLATKISFINEIAGLCELIGADVQHVAYGMGLDTRIGGKFLQAGLGWGGSCFPKDTQALQSIAKEYGYTLPIINASREVNGRQREFIIKKLQDAVKVIRGKSFAVLGLSFKPGTDDVRDSAGLEIISSLLSKGASIKAHDPISITNAKAIIQDSEIEWCEDVYDALYDVDAIIIATDWEAYKNLDLMRIASTVSSKIIIDGRNIINRKNASDVGFQYYGVGIGSNVV